MELASDADMVDKVDLDEVDLEKVDTEEVDLDKRDPSHKLVVYQH